MPTLVEFHSGTNSSCKDFNALMKVASRKFHRGETMNIRIASFASLIVGLVFAVNTQAESKRYLVKFKAQSTFNSVVTQMRQNTPAFFQNPHVAQFQVFNQMTTSTEALENIGLLIVETDAEAAQLKNNPLVDYVEAEVMHPAPKLDLSGRPAPVALASSNPDAMPTPWGVTAVNAPLAWKITSGENTKVMVLDTGVDQGHPALQGRIYKVQNFINDRPANDVTDGVGHGTHVSGTILANGVNGGLVGVAPKANLLMGRVCATEGCSSVGIVQGVNWAVQEKVQVLSLSLSGPFATEAEQEAFDNAEKANVLVVAASGNESKPMVGYPAALPTVLAIGAVDQNIKKADFSNWGPELGVVAPGVDVISSVPRGTGRGASVTNGSAKLDTKQFDGSPVGNVTADMVYANFGAVADFQGLSMSGKIALIQRGGGLTFHDKAVNAIAAGAKAVVIYNNKAGLDNGTVAAEGQQIAVPAVMITQVDGEKFRQTLQGGQHQSLAVAVIATDYSSYQGTSMATPHVAGVAALVRSANPKLSAAQVRAILKSTAKPLSPNDENQYGSGFVNADAAVRKARTTIPEEIPLASGF